MGIKRVHVYLTFVLLTFGFIISYSIQMTKKTEHSTIIEFQSEKKLKLQEKMIKEQERNQKLEERLQELKQQVSVLENKMGGSEGKTKGILKELEEVRMWAGLIPVKGTGLVVTLTDSSRVPESGGIVNDYIVHEEDIRKVVNELFSAGAEAVSINGQRFTVNSAIRCVGPTVLVNEVKTVPPFEISAIGQSDTLYTALNMPGGVIQQIKIGSNIEVEMDKKEAVEIPAYAGDSKDYLKLQSAREVGS